MFNCIGKVVVVNNNGIIHFGFAKQIAPELVQVGSGDGSTTSEEALEETGRETENQANGNGGNSGNGGNGSKNSKAASGKSKGTSNGKSKGKATGSAPAASKKAASSVPALPFGNLPFDTQSALLKKGFK
ncbi:hypothetical protein SAMN05216378_0389 [Paenibacillus catalpae]|uniref:Uncharacterized protein n=1 Tax=Paenibacillus catalpae TaxID=1045775 RepID=A0A1I1TBG5_9BACL|nr:hypothetical protein [Paenibacillus catalpae]SFD54468.1 hypothetical protein SAMN05216378_0389 [Paenibacillus catalpae]